MAPVENLRKNRTMIPVFFVIHDPTSLNYQGNDFGTQYRSAIFYHTPAQKTVAEGVIARLNAARLWGGPIVTEVTPASAYYPAEGYHQEYYARNPNQPYCRALVAPKIQKFRKHFLEKLRK